MRRSTIPETTTSIIHNVQTRARRLRQLSFLAHSTNARPPLSIDCISYLQHHPQELHLSCKIDSNPEEHSHLIDVHRTKRSKQTDNTRRWEKRWSEWEYRGYLLEFRRRHLCSQKAGEEDEFRIRVRVRVSDDLIDNHRGWHHRRPSRIHLVKNLAMPNGNL